MDIKIFLTPIVGAVIGFLTNWLAIKMLFRPHREIRLWGRRLPFTPGLIPKERERLAKKVADTLSDYVLTPEVIEDALLSEKIKDSLRLLISDFIDKLFANDRTLLDIVEKGQLGRLTDSVDVSGIVEKAVVSAKPADLLRKLAEQNKGLDERLSGLIKTLAKDHMGGLLGLFVNYDKLYENIKEGIIRYLEDPNNLAALSKQAGVMADKLINDENGLWLEFLGRKKLSDLGAMISPSQRALFEGYAMDWLMEALKKGAVAISRELDVATIVADKINGFSIDEAEKLLLSVVDKELRMITIIGGVLGFLIGLVTIIWK